MRIETIFFILCTICIKSQTPYLDPSFATNGVFTVLPPTNGHFIYEAGAVTTDSKIIIAGNYPTLYQPYNQQNTNIVRRLNMDGTVDTTFNSYTRLPQPNGAGYDNLYLTKVKIQDDGKILLASSMSPQLIRLNSNGLIDTSFATNGTFNPNNVLDVHGLYGRMITDIYYTDDNKILLCLEGGTIPVNTDKLIVLRLNHNGTVDTTFGTNGFITQDGYYGHLLIQNTKLVLYSGDYATPTTYTIKRYDVAGQLDATFQNGILPVPTVSGYNTYFDSWATNGTSIYIKGPALSTTGDVPLIAILKLLPNGLPDSAFGNSGLVTERYYPASVNNYMANTNYLFQNLLIDQNENLYVATSAGIASAFDNQYIKKFTSQGMVDTGFGNNGLIEVDLNGMENFRSAILQPDGKILTFGTSSSPTRGIITRLLNNTSPLSTEDPLKDHSKLKLHIYPNPVSNYIKVVPDLKSSNVSASILDLSGKLVMIGVLENHQVDVSQLSAGTYLLKIGVKTAKFIKK